PAAAAPDSGIGDWLLANGNALAASSYSSTGWAIEDALHDQMALVDWFDANVGQPKRVITGGGSLCGVLAGGAATWNTGLDAAYAFKTLLAPQSALQLVHIASPDANLQAAKKVIDALPKTPQ